MSLWVILNGNRFDCLYADAHPAEGNHAEFQNAAQDYGSCKLRLRGMLVKAFSDYRYINHTAEKCNV